MIKRRFIILTATSLVAAGGVTACGSSSPNAAATSAASAPSATGTQTPTGQAPAGGPRMGTPATGSAATKASDAATAKYPGTVERVLEQDDGSYLVHVMTSSGEVRVTVSKDFAVTGLQQGGRPQGAPNQSSSTTQSTTSS